MMQSHQRMAWGQARSVRRRSSSVGVDWGQPIESMPCPLRGKSFSSLKCCSMTVATPSKNTAQSLTVFSCVVSSQLRSSSTVSQRRSSSSSSSAAAARCSSEIEFDGS